jgi:hypothetical protein
MKTFKQIVEETVLNEGGEMYPADEMTMKELKIACYAAQNILDRLEDGAMLQRWQISAIVKAKEELASVYTSMSADEDEWEDDYEEKPMYVGFEYPRMYGEEVELDEVSKKTLKSYIGKATDELDADWQAARKGKPGMSNRKVSNRFAGVEKAKERMKEETEIDEAVEIGDYSVKKTKEKKSTSAHPNGKPIHHILHKGEVVGTIEPYSAYREKRKPGSRIVQSRTDVTHYQIHFHEGKGPRKSADIPMYHKMKHPNVQSALQSAATVHSEWMKKNEEFQLDEGYNDPVHRKSISDVVHEYVSKDDPKHNKIVDHLHKAKNYGSKTSDSLEAEAGISVGSAKRITKAVADHMKANFGSPSKTQTQAQRVDRYLKQKWVK